jgi:hypothetical protein
LQQELVRISTVFDGAGGRDARQQGPDLQPERLEAPGPVG